MTSPGIILGLDGGATKVSGVIVKKTGDSFSIAGGPLEKTYADQDMFNNAFTALDINFQMDSLRNGNIKITDPERIQGHALVKSFSAVIRELSNGRLIILGVGLPGLKTGDKRGVGAMLNGPRIPEFCRLLELNLTRAGVKLAAPIKSLYSDGYLCGLGEEYGLEGNFKHSENAYYLGGGTGTAEILKLRGSLMSFNSLNSWILKSWELADNAGNSLESYTSAGGIEKFYNSSAETGVNAGDILKLALAGHEKARNIFSKSGKKLGDLIYERIATIYSGWQGTFNYLRQDQPPLISNHPFLNILLHKIVLGQRLAQLLEKSKGSDILYTPFLTRLTSLIKHSISLDEKARNHYLKNNVFDETLLALSTLRAVPALGAGIQAFEDWKQSQ